MPRVNMGQAQIWIYSFNAHVKSPLPHYEFNLDSFRDPMGNKNLISRCKDGTNQLVKDWIKLDPRFSTILNQCIIITKDLERSELKWLSLGFRDYHGIWKSCAVAELVGDELSSLGYNVGVSHVQP